MLVFLALACVDPEYGHLGDALDLYEDGRAALATGAPDVAAEVFSKASALDSDRAELVGWEVRALIESGEDLRALARLNAGVRRFVNSEILRFERAKLRASQGDMTGAAEDLRWLYANEAIHPIEVGEMPEFAGLKADPSTKSLVPSATVEARVWNRQEPVLLGEVHSLEFEITARTGVELGIQSLEAGADPMRVNRIVEDIVSSDEIWTRRVLRVERMADAIGQTVLGPWVIDAGTSTVVTERVVVDVIGLESGSPKSVAGESASVPLTIPSSRFAKAHAQIERVNLLESWAVVPAGMGFGPAGAELGPRMEYREYGQPVWVAKLVSGVGPVRIKKNGSVVVERP
jgi:hypothetical protein